MKTLRSTVGRLMLPLPFFLVTLSLSAVAVAQPIQVSPTVPASGNLIGAPLGVSSNRVVYQRSGVSGNMRQIFSADLSSPGSERVLSTEADDLLVPPILAANGRIVYVGTFGFLPDGSSDPDEMELFSADAATAGSQVRLSSSGVGYVSDSLALTPDKQRVVFVEGTRVGIDVLTNQVAAVPVAGGAVTGLSSDPATDFEIGGNSVGRGVIRLSPDGTKVMYRGAGPATSFDDMLFVASTTQAGTQFQVSTTSVDGEVENLFEWLPSGNNAVYAGDLTDAGVVELFRSQTQNPKLQARLSARPIVAGGEIDRTIVPPATNDRVIYRGDLEIDGRFWIYSSPANAANQIRLNVETAGSVAFDSIRERTGGGRVVFAGNLTDSGRTDLYAAATDTALSSILLTASGATGSGVSQPEEIRLLSDGETVLFLYQRNAGGPVQLFKASISTTGSAELLGYGDEFDDAVLSIQRASSRVVRGGFAVSDDESQVIYATRNSATQKLKIWVAPIDGSTPPELISEPTAWPNPNGGSVAFTPSGRPLYVMDQLAEGDVQLFTIPAPVVPAPPVVNPPVPEPEPSAKRPTVRVRGKKKIVTRKPRIVIRGQAVSEIGVTRVEFKVGKGKFKRARGTSKWRAVVKLGKKTKRAKVVIRSVDAAGTASKPIRVRVIRRR